ncbi:MAG: OmpA family protein [Cyclobacteriaceae bacterium]
MHKHYHSILTLILVFAWLLPQLGIAQSRLATDDKKALKYYAEASAFFRRAQFREATEVLEKAIDRDNQFVEAYLMSADAFDRLRDGNKALITRQRLIEAAPNHPKSVNSYFQLGQALFGDGDYLKARDFTETFLKIAVDRPDEFQQAQQTLLSIEFALRALDNPVDFSPTPLPPQVNQFALQYFPAVTVDESTLIYTGRRGLEPYYDEDIYVVEKDEAGQWGLPSSITNLINTDNNEGACTISADGRTIIFTSCQGRNGLGSCDLYTSMKRGDEWGEPVNMGAPVNSASWESQPSLSADGRTLFFSSNRGGGFGKRDLWVTTKGVGGDWSLPINLGDKINSSGDDISPFIHFNGQDLYFSSNGHIGMGGFDLYKSNGQDQAWEQVTNLGYPINDHEDQVSLFITAEGSTAYYANESSENGRIMSSDIYQFELAASARIEHRSNFLTGIVTDSQTGNPLESQIKVYDVNTNTLVSEVYSDPLNGEYFVVLTEGQEYAIAINRPGYLFQNLSFDYLEKEGLEPERLDIQLDPIAVGAQTVLKNIFFKTNEYELQTKSEAQLVTVIEFLKRNPRVVVEISGHTDSTGSDQLNKKLSINRARSVYQYLIDNEIVPQRLSFEGYGSAQPVADNTSEDGKALNRRIEFKIIRL